MSLNESDTRAKLIDPVLHKKGWIEDLIVREEMPGTIDIIYELPKRRKRGKVDYILNIRTSDKSRKIPIAFIEAKKEDSVEKETYQSLNNSPLNYNNYAWSLMKDDEFLKRHKAIIKAIDQLESK